jgi:hypothetical protein
MPMIIGETGSTLEEGLQDLDLILNSLALVMDDPAAEGYLFEVSADGTEWGNPEAVIASIQSQLQDGSLESHDRDDNRQASIQLRISAPGSSQPGRAIALGQKALELACRWPSGQVRELRWTSPLAGAEVTVTEMTSATVGKAFDDEWDLGEVLHKERRFTLTIHARPFVRGDVPATIAAPSVIGSTTTTVDSGSSTTGWSLLSTAPAATTNLITDPNVTGLNGWAAGGGTTSLTYDGGLLATATQGTSDVGYVNSIPYTVAAGRAYQFGVNATAIDSWGTTPFGMSFGIMLRWYSDTAASVQIGTDVNYSALASATEGSSVDVATPVILAPAGALRVRLFPYTPRSPYRAVRWRINTRWINECATSVDLRKGYFDGGTTDTPVITYAWTGTANASTSTAIWSAPTLTVVSGAVQASVYGRSAAVYRRNNTGITPAAMASLPYMRVRGTASAYSDGQVTVADNGGATITPDSYTYNQATGAYEILLKRAAGFANLDVSFARTSGTVSTTAGLFVNVDQIDITDNPFANGKVQSRQVQIYGSQRAELSLSVLGLDSVGTTPVALGEQVLVYTASAADDPRVKFAAVRALSSAVGSPTTDTTATSGFYNGSSTIASGTYPKFTMPVTSLLPGTYDVYASIQATTAGTHTVSLRADQDAGLDAVQTGAWQSVDIATGSAWPQIPTSTWRLVPIGTVTVGQNAVGTISLSLASSTGSQIRVDDLFMFHRSAGQLSLLDTKTATASFSAVRLDAATVTSPKPAAWVGIANGTMMDAALAGRCQAFDQHKAEPGLLQIVTITPACATSRVSATYYERFAHDAATVTAA